jgi:hypothetical protein
MKPNAHGYHVWEMGIRDRRSPVRQVNRKPLELKAAKDLARIGATEGKHDRAVTTNPKSRQGFRIVAQYEARTGENVTAEVYRGRPRRKKEEYEENPAPVPQEPNPPELSAEPEPAFE